MRYVLTANAPETKDNDFSWKDFQARNNSELVAIFGNFVNRAVVLTHKYFEGKVPACGELQEIDRAALAASFTKAVSDSLVPRTVRAAKELGYGKVVVAGGVAANSRIRAQVTALAQRMGVRLCLPELRFCGDNAAMIGAQGYYEYLAGNVADMTLNAYATKSLVGETL